jgi:hypothetical protein
LRAILNRAAELKITNASFQLCKKQGQLN